MAASRARFDVIWFNFWASVSRPDRFFVNPQTNGGHMLLVFPSNRPFVRMNNRRKVQPAPFRIGTGATAQKNKEIATNEFICMIKILYGIYCLKLVDCVDCRFVSGKTDQNFQLNNQYPTTNKYNTWTPPSVRSGLDS